MSLPEPSGRALVAGPFQTVKPATMSRFFRPASRTVFNTPLLSAALRQVSAGLLRGLGWRLEGDFPPDLQKAVVIGAPHTSNWDLPYMLMVAFAIRRPVHWLGKVQLFRFPFGGLMRWLGGVPVDRSRSNNLVDAAIACFQAQEESFFLVVPPEGTRSKVREWKTGFYYIAHGAGVPIVMAYMDHGCRQASVATLFHPSGDIESDMGRIRAFYAPFKGRNPGGLGQT